VLWLCIILVSYQLKVAPNYPTARYTIEIENSTILIENVMEQIHPLVAEYKATILGFDPPAFAKMNELGSERKYTKIYRRLSHKLLQAHLRGDVTLAVCLINSAGSARTAVLDIDKGGEAALSRILYQAEQRQLIAFAQSSRNEEHNGGHVWLLFDAWREPDRFRHLADILAQAAAVKAETYPTRKSIRLPLGVHRWTGNRGQLYLPSGVVLNLDAGEHVVRHAVRELWKLPQNAVDQLPTAPPLLPRNPRNALQRRSVAQEAPLDFIHDYNTAIDLLAFLERLGGRVAQYLPSGSVLMHCPCPHHQHNDARPSIELRPAKNRERYGEFVIFGYAPGCLFYTERGQIVDAFSAY
jgi:hypothetical protein